jgi:hypothetical protein
MSEHIRSAIESTSVGAAAGGLGGLAVGEFINLINTAPHLTGRFYLDAVLVLAGVIAGGTMGRGMHDLQVERQAEQPIPNENTGELGS